MLRERILFTVKLSVGGRWCDAIKRVRLKPSKEPKAIFRVIISGEGKARRVNIAIPLILKILFVNFRLHRQISLQLYRRVVLGLSLMWEKKVCFYDTYLFSTRNRYRFVGWSDFSVNFTSSSSPSSPFFCLELNWTASWKRCKRIKRQSQSAIAAYELREKMSKKKFYAQRRPLLKRLTFIYFNYSREQTD